MQPVSLVDHADAFLALLRAVNELTVYPEVGGPDKFVPADAAPPFVAVRIMAERAPGTSMTMQSSRMRMLAYTYCVGANSQAAREVSDLVAATVLDVVPVVAGRVCFPIRHDVAGREPLDDESIGTLVSTIVDVYRLESLPGHTGS